MAGKAMIVPVEAIAQLIYLIREHKVMLDSDLARLYGVPVYRLNEAVKRNRVRFPEDFMFQLTAEETANLRSQIAISSWGGPRYQPHVFTEHGVAMLASVLRSKKAIEVNIAIVRTFIRLREILATHHAVARRLQDLEARIGIHDAEIQNIFDAIRQLMAPPKTRRRRIGF